MMKRAGVLVLVVGLVGCAGYRPVVDLRGADTGQYGRDLAECQAYAEQVSPVEQSLVGGLLGGLFGAALGAATGAALGDPGTGAAVGAASMGVVGAGAGAAQGADAQRSIIRNCLAGRGYRVLN